MIPGFEAIVEERIKKAQKEGAFDCLPGKGQPLVFEDTRVPDELRLAHKILKNAGFLPPQIEVKKEITKTQELLDQLDPLSPERSAAQKKLNYLMTKLDTMRGRSCSATLFRDQYQEKFIKKLS